MLISLISQSGFHFLRKRVFLFFANPKNLPRIMPASQGYRIEGLELFVRSFARLSCSTRLAGGHRFGDRRPRSGAASVPFVGGGLPVTELSGIITSPISRCRDRSGAAARHELAGERRNASAYPDMRPHRIRNRFGFWVDRAALFVRPQMEATFAHRQGVLVQRLREAEDRSRSATKTGTASRPGGANQHELAGRNALTGWLHTDRGTVGEHFCHALHNLGCVRSGSYDRVPPSSARAAASDQTLRTVFSHSGISNVMLPPTRVCSTGPIVPKIDRERTTMPRTHAERGGHSIPVQFKLRR